MCVTFSLQFKRSKLFWKIKTSGEISAVYLHVCFRQDTSELMMQYVLMTLVAFFIINIHA